jgi:hypothetical protein
VYEPQQRVRALTRGEGALECAFDHFERFATLPRADGDWITTLDPKKYLLLVTRRGPTSRRSVPAS